MSELNAKDLRKLSLKKLQEFAKNVEGEDLKLVNSIIAEKQEVHDKAEKAKSERAAERAKIKEDREKKREEAEQAKEERKKKREEAKIEREERRKENLKAKEERAAEREKKKKELDAEKAKKAEDRAAKKIEREKKLEKIQKEKEEKAEQKAREKVERAKRAQEALKNFSKDTGSNKSQEIRDCMATGMTNDEIVEATGFPRKFVCDTVWRIEKQLEKAASEKEEDKDKKE